MYCCAWVWEGAQGCTHGQAPASCSPASCAPAGRSCGNRGEGDLQAKRLQDKRLRELLSGAQTRAHLQAATSTPCRRAPPSSSAWAGGHGCGLQAQPPDDAHAALQDSAGRRPAHPGYLPPASPALAAEYADTSSQAGEGLLCAESMSAGDPAALQQVAAHAVAVLTCPRSRHRCAVALLHPTAAGTPASQAHLLAEQAACWLQLQARWPVGWQSAGSLLTGAAPPWPGWPAAGLRLASACWPRPVLAPAAAPGSQAGCDWPRPCGA